MGKVSEALASSNLGGNGGGSHVGKGDTGTVSEHIQEINLGFKEEALQKKAKEMNVGYVNLRLVPVNPDSLKVIEEKDAVAAQAVTYFHLGNKVKLASPNINGEAYLSLKKRLEADGLKVIPVLISKESLDHALKLYGKHQIVRREEYIPSLKQTNIEAFEKELQKMKELQAKLDTMPTDDAIKEVIFGAVKLDASDIHIQPEEHQVKIRFRIDGVLHDIFTMSHIAFQQFITQLKFMAKMKMNVGNVPQDGKFTFAMQERSIDIRLSMLPTDFGESVVMRLLDAERGLQSFDELGFLGINFHYLEYAIKRVNGIILVSGPTGSGKTTTLYSILRTINTPDIKIITLEDPIEYHLKNISQSQIRESEGYTFAAGLRSILRQDPDVIMVGEMRDAETAKTAIQAALTGHVVLSTIHTNSATETIPRLLNMGVDAYLMAPAISTIMAQRLVRKLCPACKKEASVSEEEKKLFEEAVAGVKEYHPQFEMEIPETIYKGQGCAVCNHTGYKGQVAVLEVLLISEQMQDVMMKTSSKKEILVQARKDGLITMKEDGMLKVMQGMTTIEEVKRVT